MVRVCVCACVRVCMRCVVSTGTRKAGHRRRAVTRLSLRWAAGGGGEIPQGGPLRWHTGWAFWAFPAQTPEQSTLGRTPWLVCGPYPQRCARAAASLAERGAGGRASRQRATEHARKRCARAAAARVSRARRRWQGLGTEGAGGRESPPTITAPDATDRGVAGFFFAMPALAPAAVHESTASCRPVPAIPVGGP